MDGKVRLITSLINHLHLISRSPSRINYRHKQKQRWRVFWKLNYWEFMRFLDSRSFFCEGKGLECGESKFCRYFFRFTNKRNSFSGTWGSKKLIFSISKKIDFFELPGVKKIGTFFLIFRTLQKKYFSFKFHSHIPNYTRQHILLKIFQVLQATH